MKIRKLDMLTCFKNKIQIQALNSCYRLTRSTMYIMMDVNLLNDIK